MADRPKMASLAALASTGASSSNSALVEWARTQWRKGRGLMQVAPGIYLSNKQAAADAELLARNGITAVCAIGARPHGHPGLVYHHVRVEDDGDSSMLPFLEASCDFIHTQASRGAVLVHCKGGINRSASLLVAYLMKYESLTPAEAFEVCSLAQPAARCPENFQRDLKAWAQLAKQQEAVVEDNDAEGGGGSDSEQMQSLGSQDLRV
ncbi:DUSP21 [Symbiodinium natans]|uniref:DUSP21 protein n=1 Tax=Symbiodinium natans TaxID=878477 RepID=A0A812K9P1_9DINO|nr:DUSP21 [Symbiodinium natans]